MKTRWIAEGITGCMDFGRQTSAGATDTFLGAIPFFAPALCWWARTIVLSIWAYSLSASAASTSKTRCQTPHLLQRMWQYESLESRQSVRADRARECRRDNDRALPRQRGDYPWQSLRRFPLCRGANAQYVATDHHGEHSVWWSWDFSSIWKGKRVFSSKKNDIPQTIKCLFDDRP